jgi:hypothetical protein
MYSYNTSIPVKPVVPYQDRMAALGGLSAQSPYKTPGAHSDVYAHLSKGNQTSYDRAVQMADQSHMQRATEMQNQMALRGLQQLSQQRENQQNLANRRTQMVSGFLNGLLTDLYR